MSSVSLERIRLKLARHAGWVPDGTGMGECDACSDLIADSRYLTVAGEKGYGIQLCPACVELIADLYNRG